MICGGAGRNLRWDARSGKNPQQGLVWQPLTDNKRSGCRGACFVILFPWLLFKAVSLRMGILYHGGRLTAWVGGWIFVLVFLSMQRILLEYRLQEEKVGVNVSSGTVHQHLAWYQV